MKKAGASWRWTRRAAIITAILVGVPALLSVFVTLEFADARASSIGGIGGGVLYVEIEVNSIDNRPRGPLEWSMTTHGPKLDTRPIRRPVRSARPYIGGAFRDIIVIDIRLWAVALAAAAVAVMAWAIGRRFRDRAKCGECGYDLRGLSHGICPECGSPLAPERPDPPAPVAI